MTTYTFTPDERGSFLSYREQFSQLSGHRLLFDKDFAIAASVSWKLGGVVETGLKNYDRDIFYSFMIMFRQFTLQDGGPSFLRTCNMVGRIAKLADRADILEVIDDARRVWKSNWSGCGILKMEDGDGFVYTTHATFDLFVNGCIAHSDTEKSGRLREMPEFQRNALLSNLRASLGNMFNCLANIDLCLDVILNRPEKRLIKTPPMP